MLNKLAISGLIAIFIFTLLLPSQAFAVVPSPPPVQPETAPPQEPESLVDRITSFFSGLFGFLYGYELIPDAYAVTEIHDFRLKFVVQFNMTGVTLNQVTNFVNNVLEPDLQASVVPKLNANFIDWSIKKEIIVLNLEGERFEVIPKLLFSGNTTLTKEQLRNGLDVQIDDWRDIVEGHMETQNGFDVHYHMHKSIGTIENSGAN